MLSRLTALALLPLCFALSACDVQTVDGGSSKPDPTVKPPSDRQQAAADLEQATRGLVRKIDLSEVKGRGHIEATKRRWPKGALMLKARFAVLEPKGKSDRGASAGILWRAEDGSPDIAIRLAEGGNLVMQDGIRGDRIFAKASRVAPNNREVLLTVLECGNELQVYKGETFLMGKNFGKRPLAETMDRGRIGLYMEPDAAARFDGFTLKARPVQKALPDECQTAINKQNRRRN